MPNYGSSLVNSLYQGDVVFLFNAETPSPPQASQAFAFVPMPGIYSQSFAVELQFSGAPGAFEVDIQGADTDVDAAYQTIPTGGTITVANANNYARSEFVPIKSRFVRALLKSRTNAVSSTIKLTR